jgi:hypothetical protein
MKINAKELHKELWYWLAENPFKYKLDWPRWMRNGGDIPDFFGGHCFACEVSLSCLDCAIDWGTFLCGDQDSIYKKWENARTKALKSKYAKQIAERPWRGKEEIVI